MKKQILTSVLLITTLFSFSQSTETKATKLGLVSELVYTKSISENRAIRILNDSTLKMSDKIQFVNLYNNTKTIIDQVLIQLSTDCKIKNSVKYVRKLDKLLTNKSLSEINVNDFKSNKLKSYVPNLKKIDSTFKILTSYVVIRESVSSIEVFFPAAASIEEITKVLSFVTSTVNSVRESKEKKVEKITKTIDTLRLKPLSELLQEEEKKKED